MECGRNACWAPKEEGISLDYSSDNLEALFDENMNYVSREFNIVFIIFLTTSLVGVL